jgi:cytochrome c2
MINKKIKHLILIFSIILIALLIFFMISDLRLKPIIAKYYLIFKYFGNYKEKILDDQYPNHIGMSRDEIIETSHLPINMESIYIPSQLKFASFGGDISPFNKDLMLMDRIGNIFALKDNNFIKFDFQAPNNLQKFLSSPLAPNLNVDTMRAHSIAYSNFNSEIFISYTRYFSPTNFKFVVSSIKINPDSLVAQSNWKTIYEVDIPPNFFGSSQAGGGKLFAKGDKLLFSIGYANEKLQELNSPFGKIYSINLNSMKIDELSSGHRNVQGLTVNLTGNIFATEHGPQGGDEINFIEINKNYGFPYKTYGTDYFKYSWPIINNTQNRFTEPLFSFIPSIGICGIIALDNYHTKWNDNLLIGSLKSQSIFRTKYINGRLVFMEPIYLGHRIRSLAQIDKTIYALTDDSYLLKLTVNEGLLKRNQKGSDGLIDSSLAKCITCHNFEKNKALSSASLSLHKIINRPIASLSNFKYSESLSSINGNWSRENLKLFLLNPNNFAPGTKKPNLGLNDFQVDQIIKSLENM